MTYSGTEELSHAHPMARLSLAPAAPAAGAADSPQDLRKRLRYAGRAALEEAEQRTPSKPTRRSGRSPPRDLEPGEAQALYAERIRRRLERSPN